MDAVPASCSRAVAERADTARPTAWATAGSSAAGSGVFPSRRLNADSASYGTARDPYTSRSASRVSWRRIGWNASATTASASSDSHTLPAWVPITDDTATTTTT